MPGDAAVAAAPLIFGLEKKDLLTALGIAASLGLGIFNFFAAKSLRRGTIALEELRSQFRDPLQAKLDRLSKARNDFTALAKPNALKIDELRSKLLEIVADVEFACLEVRDDLTRADQSTFMKGTDWLAAFDSLIEAILQDSERLSAPKVDMLSIGAGLNSVLTHIEDLNRALSARLEAEVKLHLPRFWFWR